jgi:hypothetical protein
MCRTLGHAWTAIPATSSSRFGDAFWLQCVRCTTERHDDVSWMSGELLGRRYVYPDTYRHAFDSQFADAAPTRQDYRRILFAEHLQKVRNLRAVRSAG